MTSLTATQASVLSVLRSQPDRGFDAAELARKSTGGTPAGAARSAASLVRRGLAIQFMGGVGPQRMHFQAATELDR